MIHISKLIELRPPRFMKNSFRLIALAVSVAFFSIAAQAQVLVMQPLTTFGTNGDGSLRPGDAPFLTPTNQLQRGMAYNPTTGHLLVVDRSTSSSVNNDVYILDGNTGATLGTLNNGSTLAGGNAAFTLNLVGVADDGAIYVANLTSSTATNFPQFRLYRWSSETDLQTIVYPPLIVGFSADPSNGDTNSFQKRWGDTMTVRGSGTNTQVLIANRGTLAALFTPNDSSLAAFSPRTLTTDVNRGALGYGLTFGAGDTFFGTSGAQDNGPLLRLQFNAVAGTATTLNSYPSPDFPGTISPILFMPSSNLLAGITMVSGADVVRLYDVSNPAVPVLLDRKSFVTTNNNNVFGGSLALGTNGVLYALDSDNGIMAFTLTNAASNPLPPAFFLHPANKLAVAGNSTTFTSGADSSLPVNYQWFFFGTNALPNGTNATLTLTNLQSTDAGNYSVVASNSLGSATSSVAVLTVVLTPPNTLLIYDPFPYAPGSSIAGQGNWFSTSTTGTGDSGNLDVPGLAASISNRLTWSGSSMSLRLTNGAITLSGSIYFSFAYRIDNLGTLSEGVTGNTVAGFAIDNTMTAFGTKINVHTNITDGLPGYNIGVFKGGGETTGAYATNILALGETVFVVGRYVFGDGTSDDTCALWVNPHPSTFGTANAPTPSAGDIGVGVADLSQITRFFFRASGATPARTYADEVRVGLDWADVTPPLLANPTLAITLNGNVTLSWPTLPSGFNLEGAPNLNSPIGWAPVTNSVTIVGTNNTVTVNATSGNEFFRLKK